MIDLLRVSDLTKKFEKGDKTFTAVDNVSFSINANECVGIVGESGSGKTTIAKIICKFTAVDEGEIFLNENNVTEVKRQALKEYYRNVQMIFQNPYDSFNPKLTVGKSLREPLSNRGYNIEDNNAEIKKMLELCGLGYSCIMDKYPYEISGGQCQRAAIARALLASPRILICDEATSALDVVIQKQIIELLSRLKEETGISILFITHDIAVAQSLCDGIIVMNKGQIVEEGDVEQVLRYPKDEYTIALLNSVI